MTVLAGAESVVGGLILFFVPGFFVARALFPEWKFRGPGALMRIVETVTLSFVLSLVLTVLAGYVLLSAAPGGFQSAWSDPVLEAILAGVAVVALGAAIARGAFSRAGPTVPRAASDAGEYDAWELSRELERLGREERHLEHALRATHGTEEARQIREHLEQVRAKTDELRRRREAEYAE